MVMASNDHNTGLVHGHFVWISTGFVVAITGFVPVNMDLVMVKHGKCLLDMVLIWFSYG